MAGIMDQATCGEVHNANLRSVFPTGNRTRPGKNLPLFLKFANSVEKNTPFSWFRGHAKSEKMPPFSVKLWTWMRTHLSTKWRYWGVKAPFTHPLLIWFGHLVWTLLTGILKPYSVKYGLVLQSRETINNIPPLFLDFMDMRSLKNDPFLREIVLCYNSVDYMTEAADPVLANCNSAFISID